MVRLRSIVCSAERISVETFREVFCLKQPSLVQDDPSRLTRATKATVSTAKTYFILLDVDGILMDFLLVLKLYLMGSKVKFSFAICVIMLGLVGGQESLAHATLSKD